MTDTVGQVVVAWTVTNLKPGMDATPGYTQAGKLWEATATVKAIRAASPPPISQFNAIDPNEAAYRVLWYVVSPTNVGGRSPRRRIDRQDPLRCHRSVAFHRDHEQRDGRPPHLGAITDGALRGIRRRVTLGSTAAHMAIRSWTFSDRSRVGGDGDRAPERFSRRRRGLRVPWASNRRRL